MNEILQAEDGPVFIRDIVVQQIDTEMSGAAQVSAWIRWMEETEYAFLRSIGLSVSMRDERGQFGFPRLSASVQFHRPVFFGQQLTMEMRTGSPSGKQIEYLFRAWSADRGNARNRMAEGRFVVACCRFPAAALPYAIPIPDFVLEKFSSIRRPTGD